MSFDHELTTNDSQRSRMLTYAEYPRILTYAMLTEVAPDLADLCEYAHVC
jgi:hypothetical protein